MSYEDVIRVANLKTRRERLQRVRAEVGAKPDEPVMLVEYLKPGVEELCSVLPKGMASLVRRWGHRHGGDIYVGLHVKTTSTSGFAMLVALRSILDDEAKSGARTSAEMAERLHAARRAALADPESRTQAKTLGLPMPEVQARPIRFSPNPKRT